MTSIIISSGGVSVGDEDHIKTAVAELGEIDFWRIAIKPGKPVAFGRIQNAAFIGLPNPPLLTFLLFACLSVFTTQSLRLNVANHTQAMR